jgi:hypothetical protein
MSEKARSTVTSQRWIAAQAKPNIPNYFPLSRTAAVENPANDMLERH